MLNMITVFHRSTLYKGLVGEPLGMSLLNIGNVYEDFSTLEKPVVANMGISDEKTLVETVFGLAQKGSILSYQQPISQSKYINIHIDPSPYPAMPLVDYSLSPTECVHVCTEQEHFHINSLMVTLDMAHKIEVATREQAADKEWHHLLGSPPHILERCVL